MQLVAERPSTTTIRAKMNYIVDTGMPPVRYIDWPEMAHKEIPPTYKEHEVTIRNGRPLRDTFRLDTHGFVFVDHHTRMKDFTDEAERKRVYDLEVAELIKKHSGASDVPGVRPHHPRRRRAGATEDRRATAGEGRAQRLHRGLGAAAAARDRRRRRGRTPFQEALGDHPGLAADPRHGDDRSARHLRRPQHSAEGLHPGAAPLQVPHRRGLPHRLQPRAQVVLLPAAWSATRRWCSRCSTPTRPCRRASPRIRRSTIRTRRRTRRRARASRRAPSRSGTSRAAGHGFGCREKSRYLGSFAVASISTSICGDTMRANTAVLAGRAASQCLRMIGAIRSKSCSRAM